MSDISLLMRKIRDSKKSETKFTQSDLGKKAAFGLPIPIFGDKKDKLNLFYKNEKKEEELRRASQFFITINNEENKYYWLVSLLNGKFKPQEYKIKYQNKEYKLDFELFNSFIDILSENANYF